MRAIMPVYYDKNTMYASTIKKKHMTRLFLTKHNTVLQLTSTERQGFIFIKSFRGYSQLNNELSFWQRKTENNILHYVG